jgi:tetratricopeptide (TPR) repeat protein
LPVVPVTQDLHLTIRPPDSSSRGYLVTLANLANGGETQQETVPDWKLAAAELAALRGLRTGLATPPAADVINALGRRLASLLLPPRVQGLLFALLARDAAATVPIRLCLEIEPPELRPLPWELAYLDPPAYMPHYKGFVGLHPRLHLIRRTEARASQREPADPLRVLVAWANPCTHSSPALPFAVEEADGVLSALKRPAGFGIQSRELAHATRVRLRDAIQMWQPHILHFIGHGHAGDGGALIVEGDRPNTQESVTGKELVEWIADLDLRLAALSACDTAGVAQTLADAGVGAVLGMQMPWREVTAPAFFCNFYSLLLQPKTVHAALNQSRQALRHTMPDWAVPVLYQSREMGALFPPTQRTRPVFNNLPYAHNPDFCGRNDDLAELHRSLTLSAQPVALVGLGGLGKTQLASEYAHRYRDQYPGGIFWFNSRDDLRIKDEYAAISGLFDAPRDLSVDGRAQFMRMTLQELREPALLIFDNVTRDTDLQLLPAVGNCRILATAREEVAVRGLFSLHWLPTLAPEAAATLLQTHVTAGDTDDLTALCEIATQLGHLPLALTLVAEHVRHSLVDMDGNAVRQPFLSYLRRLEQGPQKLLDRARQHFKAFTKHNGALFDAIEISYRALSPTAQSLLAVASCFAARGISPKLLLAAWPQADAEEFMEALADLTALSLVTREEAGRLSVHEIVRFFARGQLSEEAFHATLDRVAQVLAKQFETANEALDWREVRADVAHCRMVADLCRAQPDVPHYTDLLLQLGYYYLDIDSDQADEYLSTGLAIARKRYGEQHPDTAQFLRHIGAVRQAQGERERDRGNHDRAKARFAEARQAREQALNIVQAIYGPEDARTIDFYHDLGYILRWQGDLEGAEQYYVRALELSLQAYGPIHQQVATCQMNIAVLYEIRERFDEALGKLRRSRDIIRRLHGVKQSQFGYRVLHAKYAYRMNSIGRILRRKGKAGVALRRHQAALNVFLELCAGDPQGDINLGYTYYYIAETQVMLDRRDEARIYYELAQPILVRLLGETHRVCREIAVRLQFLDDGKA